MMELKDMLLGMMKQGKSLEDAMKEISDIANEIEREQKAAAAEREHKYLKYTKPLGEVYPESVLTSNLFARKQLYAEDVALVLAHYVCQNVPGYAEFAAQNELDLADAYRSIVEQQAKMAESMVAHKDDGEYGPLNALTESLANVITESIFGDAPFNDKEQKQTAHPTSFAPVTLSKSDAEKVQEFMRKMGLN
ncbi:MAG: hypothetical protein NC218_07245 [Acetobacter sp.]|nr:hypothetical protein [Acetobacter sp.]